MFSPDTKREWDRVWAYYNQLEKGHKFKLWDLWNFAEALRRCEAAQKDKAVNAYVIERLRQREQRRRKLRKREAK
jgi:hypothetical protein